MVRSRVLFSTGAVVVPTGGLPLYTVPAGRTALVKRIAVYVVVRPSDGVLALRRVRGGLITGIIALWTGVQNAQLLSHDPPEWDAADPGDTLELGINTAGLTATVIADASGALLGGAPA